MKKTAFTIANVLTLASAAWAGNFNVATNGNDANPGTKKSPFRTIQHAADLAQPGDVITVHAGIYRERVNPPRGGTSDKKRITYQAAPGEKVVITGSEIVKNWERVTNDTWSVTIPNSFFGKFIPYAGLIHGDWFLPNGRQHHTGAVYLNDDWLREAANLDDAIKPAAATPFWFGEVTNDITTIWAQFPGVNPNEGNVEINVRQVEPMIAASIAFVAVENICTPELKPWRPVVVFCFGLIHGLGFSSVLLSLGLPRQDFATALASFNGGVELGQLAVITAAFLAVGRWRNRKWYRPAIVIPASALIAATGIFWTVQRIMLAMR